MVAVFTSTSVLVFTSSFLLTSVGGSDTTCMLQHPSVSAVLRQHPPAGAGTARRSVEALSRAKGRPPVMLLETESATESEAEASYVNFHNPTVWGPAGWFFFHTIALAQADNIDSAQQERLRRFFTEDMPHLLPCPTCGRNAQGHIADMNISDATFANRDSVAHFVWDLHETVNAEKAGRNEVVSRPSFERSVLNYAQTYEQGVTLLHFNNSDDESAAVSVQERHKVELLMDIVKVPAPKPSMFTELFRFVTSFMAQAETDGTGI